MAPLIFYSKFRWLVPRRKGPVACARVQGCCSDISTRRRIFLVWMMVCNRRTTTVSFPKKKKERQHPFPSVWASLHWAVCSFCRCAFVDEFFSHHTYSVLSLTLLPLCSVEAEILRNSSCNHVKVSPVMCCFVKVSVELGSVDFGRKSICNCLKWCCWLITLWSFYVIQWVPSVNIDAEDPSLQEYQLALNCFRGVPPGGAVSTLCSPTCQRSQSSLTRLIPTWWPSGGGMGRGSSSLTAMFQQKDNAVRSIGLTSSYTVLTRGFDRYYIQSNNSLDAMKN